MTVTWKPNDDGGYEADVGLVHLQIDPSDDLSDGGCSVVCYWLGDDEREFCETVEEAKAVGKKLALAHLRAAIEEIEALS